MKIHLSATIAKLLAIKAQKASQKDCFVQEVAKLAVELEPLGGFVPLLKAVQQSNWEPQELYQAFTFSYSAWLSFYGPHCRQSQGLNHRQNYYLYRCQILNRKSLRLFSLIFLIFWFSFCLQHL